MRMMKRLFACLLLLLIAVVGANIGPVFLKTRNPLSSHSNSLSIPPTTPSNESIDESFYSRQLLVYGKSAQAKLANARALLVGRGPLLDETVKNLALSGVGSLVLLAEKKAEVEAEALQQLSSSPPTASLCGQDVDLAEYAKSLNPHIKVEVVPLESFSQASSLLSGGHFDVVILCDEGLDSLKAWNALSRQQNVKMISSTVVGVTGMIFTDLLDRFVVEDIEGESHKEVPLSSSWEGLDSPSDDALLLCIESIPEEKLGYGLSDVIELRSSTDSQLVIPATVEKVINTHKVVVRIDGHSKYQELVHAIENQSGLAQKLKAQKIVKHESLLQQLLKPSFNPANGCLSPKQDRALSLVLLAAFKARETLNKRLPKSRKLTKLIFISSVLHELKLLGVSNAMLPIKKGGLVGADWVKLVVDGFYSSQCSQCPATISIMGAIAAQEAIKAITQMYEPISQFLMFESIDALPLKPPGFDEEEIETKERVSCYGSELMEEIAGLRVFVIGSGAIGSELLKNFALLGVGVGKKNNTLTSTVDGNYSASPATLWEEFGLAEGGILITDMDSIERSNLNRQLLFRERHIGLPKALVAAEQVRGIRPDLRIHGLTLKVSSETEEIFSAAFWQSTDVVITALDNVEARKYVDEQCLKYKCFMLDSGTLGTKANTQVVIPYLTETYSSSADPPEEAVPLCTIKSFPYQPEHCVAWAKNMFNQYFQQDIQNLNTICSTLSSSSLPSKDILQSWSVELTHEDQISLIRSLSCQGQSSADIRSALTWARETFITIFRKEVEQLMRDHPLDSLDDEGLPFWGGSRRVPKLIPFDLNDPLVAEFLVWSTFLYLRSYGMKPTTFETIIQEMKSQQPIETVASNPLGEQSTALEQLAEKFYSQDNFNRWKHLQSMEFEKDDLSLGHVQWVRAAANLRARLYGIRELETLEVQKLAGNIIPALATTTSVVGGLITQELVKVATERLAFKHFQQSRLSAPLPPLPPAINSQPARRRSLSRWFRSKLPSLASFNKSPFKDEDEREEEGETAKKMVPLPGNDPRLEAFKLFIRQNKDRLLKKFRNAFVNLARPLVAFTQPMEAPPSTFLHYAYNLWDQIEVPIDLEDLTLRGLADYLDRQFDLQIVSVAMEDQLLFANFLPDKEQLLDLPLMDVLDKLSQEMEEPTSEREERTSSGNIYEGGAVPTARPTPLPASSEWTSPSENLSSEEDKLLPISEDKEQIAPSAQEEEPNEEEEGEKDGEGEDEEEDDGDDDDDDEEEDEIKEKAGKTEEEGEDEEDDEDENDKEERKDSCQQAQVDMMSTSYDISSEASSDFRTSASEEVVSGNDALAEEIESIDDIDVEEEESNEEIDEDGDNKEGNEEEDHEEEEEGGVEEERERVAADPDLSSEKTPLSSRSLDGDEIDENTNSNEDNEEDENGEDNEEDENGEDNEEDESGEDNEEDESGEDNEEGDSGDDKRGQDVEARKEREMSQEDASDQILPTESPSSQERDDDIAATSSIPSLPRSTKLPLRAGRSRRFLEGKKFIVLDVIAALPSEGGDEDDGFEVHMPPIIVKIGEKKSPSCYSPKQASWRNRWRGWLQSVTTKIRPKREKR